jgi:hypothetical protein
MKAYALDRAKGEAIWMFDALDTIKADADGTGGGFSVSSFSISRALRCRFTSTTGGIVVFTSSMASTRSS